MAGRRVAPDAPAQTRTKGSKAGWIALGLIAALLVAGAAGLCVYANQYDKVFPGVSLGERDLSGMTEQQLRKELTVGGLLSGEVSITAAGEELGRYTQEDLGAYIDGGKLADAAWDVGREEGGIGWLKNGWAMLSGWLGVHHSGDMEVFYDDNTLQAAAEEMAAAFDQTQVDGSYELTEDGIYAVKPAEGRTLDQPELIDEIKALDGAGGKVEAGYDAVPGAELDLEAIARELNAEPSNARYDIPSGKVVDGQIGVNLDPQAAAFALDAAAPGERILLPAEVTYPKMTAAELEAVLFRDVLGTTSTKVGGTSVRRNNVKLAGDMCNGVVLNDGDIFDYNAVVGKRTTDRGFGAAPAYVNGETVDTIGGGICQVSSTIYYAALLSNLEIVERYAHRYAPSYITWGMDATVSWGGPEFRFKNDTGYPVRLDVTYENSRITVSVVGTKLDDTYVKMTYSVLGDTPYETEYVETEDLDWGTEQQKQSPYTGHQVVSYRNVYDGSGKLISQELEAKSNYKSRNEIILVGTRGKPAMGTTIPDFGGSSDPGSSGGNEGYIPPEGPTVPPEDDYGYEDEGPTLPPEDGSPGLSIFG
ncbi:MAG: VanW family protein [Oscillospiraceae bacterium]|nr:VanW family protein [Oscillospiraceae bacterium]